MATDAGGDRTGAKGAAAAERRRGQRIQFTASCAPDEEKAERARAWLESVAARVGGGFFDGLAVSGMRVERVGGGTVICSFPEVPRHLADADGIWTPGAIAAAIDVVGAVAIASLAGELKASVVFDISYFAPVNVEEEVEIEGKVSYQTGQLTAVTVDVRKKGSAQPVACGRQWMASLPETKRAKL